MRSKLFVPAIRVELFDKALRSGADAVCFDLEDAVAPGARPEARQHLEQFLARRSTGSPLLLVRTNTVSSSDFPLDLTSAVWPSTFAITLPKVESPEDIQRAENLIAALELDRAIGTPLGILPTIESPRGLRMAAEIALASPRIIGLQIGFADLLEPLGIPPGNITARNQIRLTVRLAAAEARLDCYDSAFPDFRNLTAYHQQLDAAHAFGFAGSSCIHPSQVAAANITFTLTSEELDHARRIAKAAQAAAERGDAVTTLDGKMIDRPFILAAQRLLQRERVSEENK